MTAARSVPAASRHASRASALAPAPRPNKRALAKTRTRARVLDAAAFLFATAGFFATGIRDVAARAGMSTGAVFANFEGKEHLWREAMGCPAPDPRLAEEAALTVAAHPDQPFWIYADGDRCKASIGNPVRALAVPGEGGCHGAGETPAEALRQARLEAARRRAGPARVGSGGPEGPTIAGHPE